MFRPKSWLPTGSNRHHLTATDALLKEFGSISVPTRPHASFTQKSLRRSRFTSRAASVQAPSRIAGTTQQARYTGLGCQNFHLSSKGRVRQFCVTARTTSSGTPSRVPVESSSVTSSFVPSGSETWRRTNSPIWPPACARPEPVGEEHLSAALSELEVNLRAIQAVGGQPCWRAVAGRFLCRKGVLAPARHAHGEARLRGKSQSRSCRPGGTRFQSPQR